MDFELSFDYQVVFLIKKVSGRFDWQENKRCFENLGLCSVYTEKHNIKHDWFFFKDFIYFLFFLLPKAPQYIAVCSSCGSFQLWRVGRCLSVAWRAVPCPRPVFEPWAAAAERANLTTRPWSRLPHDEFLFSISSSSLSSTVDNSRQNG